MARKKKKRRKTVKPHTLPPLTPISELVRRIISQNARKEVVLREPPVPDTMSATGIEEELGELLG